MVSFFVFFFEGDLLFSFSFFGGLVGFSAVQQKLRKEFNSERKTVGLMALPLCQIHELKDYPQLIN